LKGGWNAWLEQGGPVEPKAELKPGPKPDAKPDSKTDPNSDSKPEPKKPDGNH